MVNLTSVFYSIPGRLVVKHSIPVRLTVILLERYAMLYILQLPQYCEKYFK